MAKVIFPDHTKPLKPDDERTPIIFRIVTKLFQEI